MEGSNLEEHSFSSQEKSSPSLTSLSSSSSSSSKRRASKASSYLSFDSTKKVKPRCRIRQRYLNRIGINTLDTQQRNASSATVENISPQLSPKSRAPLHETSNEIPVVHEPLKGDYGQVDDELSNKFSIISPPQPIPSPPSARKTRRSVKFESVVSVKLIPTRNDYSDRVRKFLWFGHIEMECNMKRNILEFAYDGWDWRQISEDMDMVWCLESNDFVHPVHSSTVSDCYGGGAGGGYRYQCV